ncbi:MAG TPA: helix-turn-helix domain-containing protein, partial [Spirochaetota bacterium]|nr:helix-turn-helix domain-containing protein [Spirochaetota bacterium]
MKKTETRPIHSIDRAIDLLMLFSDRDTGLTISEMSERLGVPKTTVRGIANTLANRNLLEQRDGSAEYTLGGVM